MRVEEAIKFIKQYDGFKELKAIGVLVLEIYKKVCGGTE